MANEIDDLDPQGATQTRNAVVVDAGLADWIYHRGLDDQAIKLGEIAPLAEIVNKGELNLSSNFAQSDDGFIYDRATGFCAAVVHDETGYAIVVRGTDVGSAGN